MFIYTCSLVILRRSKAIHNMPDSVLCQSDLSLHIVDSRQQIADEVLQMFQKLIHLGGIFLLCVFLRGGGHGDGAPGLERLEGRQDDFGEVFLHAVEDIPSSGVHHAKVDLLCNVGWGNGLGSCSQEVQAYAMEALQKIHFLILNF